MPRNSLPSKPTEYGSISEVGASAWNGLSCATGPFADWRFLAALEHAGCVGNATGWLPSPLTVHDDAGRLRVAAPAWIKSHSHGEFVFDWAWARAAHGAGLTWYPKLLIGVPFSPVPGPRLLGAELNPEAAIQLLDQARDRVEDKGYSSAGINFCSPADAGIIEQRPEWLARHDWQFHWHNDGYCDFDDFLDALKRKPRKNIRAERRKVFQQGWRFEWIDGTSMTDADIDFADRCYQSTFMLYGNMPMLNRAFFALNAERFGKDFLMCRAHHNDRPRAAAIFWRDHQRLYGRYWGSLEDTRDVHFETCYYQGIEYCIENGLQWFEPGAQGEHKIRRGFLPQKTRSFHYIRHPGLRQGIAHYLVAEARALREYRQHLDSLDPFGARGS
jgi:uncharacterized protein